MAHYVTHSLVGFLQLVFSLDSSESRDSFLDVVLEPFESRLLLLPLRLDPPLLRLRRMLQARKNEIRVRKEKLQWCV